MAAGYVDDHRVILYRDGAAARDITAFCGDLTAKDDLDALSVEVTFHIFKSVWDKYTPALNLAPGDKIRIVNHGNAVFSGVVVTVTLDGTVTAYDRGWYLNKSEIILQVNNLAADQVIRQASAKAGVSVASVCSLPTKITQLWTGKTPADIFDEVLETAEAETGKNYYYYVAERGLVVAPLPTSAIKAMHRPAENLPGFDITWALGEVSGEDSISDTYNAVVIAAESDGRAYRGAQASNAASIARYGFLQKVETVTENPGTAALGQRVRNLLASADRVGRKRQISEIWGCDEVRSGVVLDFNSPAFGISGRHRVTSVTHQYGGAGHVMSLEISALDEPRAAAAGKSSAAAVKAASADSVKVWGLPDLGGGASGGTTVKALFTAYYPAANALEGGFLDAQGNRLDPSKKTCAAPPSVAFGTKVTVQGTGTSLDGETYTVNDRGGAIQIENGVYHFDLLMRTNAECNSWGRKRQGLGSARSRRRRVRRRRGSELREHCARRSRLPRGKRQPHEVRRRDGLRRRRVVRDLRVLVRKALIGAHPDDLHGRQRDAQLLRAPRQVQDSRERVPAEGRRPHDYRQQPHRHCAVGRRELVRDGRGQLQ